MAIWLRVVFLIGFCLPLLAYFGEIFVRALQTHPDLYNLFDQSMRQRFLTSATLGACTALLAGGFGVVAYAGYLSLGPRIKTGLLPLALLPLSFPPFGVATAWMTLIAWPQAAAGQRIIWGGEEAISQWFYGLPGAAWVLALCWWPVVFFLLALHSRPARREVEAARLHAKGWGPLALIYWRSWRRPLFFALAIVFGMGLTQFEVPSLLQVNAYALEIYVRFSATLDETAGVLLSLPYMVLCIVLGWMAVRWNHNMPHDVRQERAPIQHWGWRMGWIGGAVLLLVISCLFPLAMLAWHTFATPDVWQNIAARMPAAGRSLAYAFFTALTLLVLAMGVMAWRGQTLRAWVFALGFFSFFLPGILIGSAWLRFRSHWPGASPQWLTLGSMLWAMGFHNWLIAAGAAFLLWRRFGERPHEAAKLLPLSFGQRIWRIYLPHFFQPAIFGVLLIALFVWREVAIPILMHPPGGDTLAMQYFNMLHYGSQPRTATVGFVMMLSPVLMLFVGWGVFYAAWKRE